MSASRSRPSSEGSAPLQRVMRPPPSSTAKPWLIVASTVSTPWVSASSRLPNSTITSPVLSSSKAATTTIGAGLSATGCPAPSGMTKRVAAIAM